MKKLTLAAAALLPCMNTAIAQTNVTIYGIADAGLVIESGGVAGRVNKLTSGIGSASRIGFRGVEDLGGGISALFTLETGYRIDTGEVDAAGALFNRQAYVGLKSRAGTITIGRQYTPWHQALAQVADPFGTGFAGGAKNLFPDFGANVRASNTVMVTAPPMNGFSADLAYSAGEQAGNHQAGRQFGASLGYAKGPLNLRLAYNNKNGDMAAANGAPAINRGNGTNILVAANYDFKVLRAYAAWGADKGYNSAPLGNTGNPYGGARPTPSTDGRDILLGLSAPLAGGTLLASVMHKDDRTGFDQDARSWGLGYLYPLSKRTTLYTAWGMIDNRNGAGYTVANNSETGTGDRAFNLGVRHTF